MEQLIKITVSPQGQQKIEKEANDVKTAWNKIDDTPVVQNVGQKFQSWAKSPEVQRLKALDQQFLASPEGKRMMKEWKEFAIAVKQNTHETKNGIHIPNDKVKQIEGEWNDVEGQYKGLKGTHWETQYQQGWDAAIKNNQAKQLGQSIDAYEHSPQGHYMNKELEDLGRAIKENVKVTDIPKMSMADMSDDMFIV